VGLTLQFLESATLTASTPSPATVVVNTGLPGPQGPAGDSATIAVGTVTALPYGSAPTVNNVGTSSAAIFNFGVVAGPTGATGPAGVGVVAGGLAGQALAKINGTDFNTHWVDLPSLTGYATESWVTSQGYITSSALTPYLTSAAAASTYLTITNAASTYATNAALSSYLTVAAASSTYYPLTNPSSFITSAALSPYLTSALAATTYAPIIAAVPTGGSTGQVLAKSSGTNYATSWQTPAVGDKYYTTSTTSLSISNGAKTLTVATGLSYTTQQDVIIAYDAGNHMHAVVTSYNSGTGVLVVDVRQHTGTGTFSLWTVNVGGISSVAEWGLITGTITNQTDLSTALGLKLPLAGGTMDASASIALSTATYNSLVSGEVFGVELTADPTQNASLSFNAVTIQDGVGTMQLSATALTFPDATSQTTAFPGFTGYAPLSSPTFNGITTFLGSGGWVSISDLGLDLSTSTGGGSVIVGTSGITFSDSTVMTTAATAYTADNAKADAVAALINYFPYYGSSVSFNSSSSIPVFITALGTSWGIYEAATSTYYSVSYVSSNTAYFSSSWGGTGPFYVQVNGTNSFLSF